MPSYKFAYPVYNAILKDSGLSFKVADVSFVTKLSLTEEFTFFDEGKKRFEDNQIFATVIEYGTKDYAKKLSYDKCRFATDIFKICSDLYHDNIFNPKKWQFDIISDYVIQGKSCYFYKNLTSAQEGTCANFHADRNHTCIDSKIIGSTTKWNISDLEFLFQTVYSPNPNNIHKVLKRACHIYSQSFSINNLHERIVLLCTVLDTLATCERERKVPQLQKYLPVMVLKCDKLSEGLKKFIKKIYDVRSAYVHNAEESDITEDEVDKLEKIVYRVVLQMIRNSTKYKSTKELCVAIDNGLFEPILDNLPDIYIPLL